MGKYTFRPMDGMGYLICCLHLDKKSRLVTKVLFGNLQILLCVRIPSIGSNQAQLLNRKIQLVAIQNPIKTSYYRW